MSGKRAKLLRKMVTDYLLSNHIPTKQNSRKFNKSAKKQWSENHSVDLTTIRVEK